MTSGWRRVLQAGAARVSGESLAVARIAFGAIGLFSAIRLFANGWVSTLLIDPPHHLRYPAMSWVPVPPAWVINALVITIAVSSLAVMVGAFHRAAVALFLFSFVWVEMIEATIYLNHYWFMTLVGISFLAVPASARWSIDALRRGPRDVPAVAVWVIRFQVGAVYAFAGIAKLNGDWFAGLPLTLWLPARSDVPLLGSIAGSHTIAVVASWAGAIFDCTVVAFFLWRRTRLYAWLVGVTFHVVTWALFPVIGVFPWLMIPMSTIMFDPDWPSRLARRVRRSAPTSSAPVTADPSDASVAVLPAAVEPSAMRLRVVASITILWVVIQVLIPFRHHLYPGDQRWSGEGFRFGWNVMAVEKAGDVRFRVTDPIRDASWYDDARDLYTPQQWRVMATDPEFIRQAAHEVALDNGATAEHPLEVRVNAVMSLNGRPAHPLIDPDVDLAAEPWRPGHQSWIMAVPETRRPS